MSTIAVEPIFMDEADLILGTGTDDYAAAVSSCTLTPNSSTVTVKGLKAGAVFTRSTKATWTLDLNYAQDWTSAQALAAYLHDHEGETIPFSLKPSSDDEADTFTGQLIATPGPIGGAVDTFAEATVSLGLLGKPVRVPAP